MFSLLNNIPQVSRNLLILNILMFILTIFFQYRGVDLMNTLSIYAFNSPLFEPYQVISHMFMHGSFMHLLMNMFGLVMFGGFLERIWGAQRFFIFYVACGLGATLLAGTVDTVQLMQLKNELLANNVAASVLQDINEYLQTDTRYVLSLPSATPEANQLLVEYQGVALSSSLGASGAVFGILAAFALLFPNTELMLLFFPVPIKAKYLIGAYVIFEIYSTFYRAAGDNINHLAHLGGALIGAIIVLFWRKRKTHFY